jgi:hypothetical protein
MRLAGKSKDTLGSLGTTVIRRGTVSFSICRRTVSAADSPNSVSHVRISPAQRFHESNIFKLHGSHGQFEVLRQNCDNGDHTLDSPLLKLYRNCVPFGSAIERAESEHIATPVQKALHPGHYPGNGRPPDIST